MKKEGLIFVVLVILFIGTMVWLNLPFFLTGYTTGNATIGNVNDAPSCLTVPNQSWNMNTEKTFNLSQYCSDPENLNLVYNATSVSEITITIVNGVVIMTPNIGFSGTRVVTFSVFDYVTRVYSNNVTLIVNSIITSGGEVVSEDGTAKIVKDTEMIILRLAPTITHEAIKEYYLEEFIVDNTAIIEDIEVGSIIYFGARGEENLAYVQVALIENKKVLINFIDKNENLLQLEFFQGNLFELDEEGNGLSDYVIYADYVGNEVVDFRFVKISKVSFELYEFVIEYGFIMSVLMVILILLIFIIKRKI